MWSDNTARQLSYTCLVYLLSPLRITILCFLFSSQPSNSPSLSSLSTEDISSYFTVKINTISRELQKLPPAYGSTYPHGCLLSCHCRRAVPASVLDQPFRGGFAPIPSFLLPGIATAIVTVLFWIIHFYLFYLFYSCIMLTIPFSIQICCYFFHFKKLKSIFGLTLPSSCHPISLFALQ